MLSESATSSIGEMLSILIRSIDPDIREKAIQVAAHVPHPAVVHALLDRLPETGAELRLINTSLAAIGHDIVWPQILDALTHLQIPTANMQYGIQLIQALEKIIQIDDVPHLSRLYHYWVECAGKAIANQVQDKSLFMRIELAVVMGHLPEIAGPAVGLMLDMAADPDRAVVIAALESLNKVLAAKPAPEPAPARMLIDIHPADAIGVGSPPV